MEAKKSRNDRDQRYPEQRIVVEPDGRTISLGESEDQIMMIAPEDRDDHEAQRIGCQERSELHERAPIGPEGKTVRDLYLSTMIVTTIAKTASEKDSMRRLVGFSSVCAGREPG